jgi:hypothetical protein
MLLVSSKTARLLLLAAGLTLAAFLSTPSYAYALPLCPTDWCHDVMNDCIVQGGNHDYFPFETTVSQCQTSIGDIFDLKYERCCKLPGCTQEIWVRYCHE